MWKAKYETKRNSEIYSTSLGLEFDKTKNDKKKRLWSRAYRYVPIHNSFVQGILTGFQTVLNSLQGRKHLIKYCIMMNGMMSLLKIIYSN